MKKLLLLVNTLLLCSTISMATPRDTILLLADGQLIETTPLVEGALGFYFSSRFKERIMRVGNSIRRERALEERYFLRIGRLVEEITPENYKKMIIKYLPKAPELHDRLGKRGFRFGNIEHMIEFYNKFKIDDTQHTRQLTSHRKFSN